MADRSILIIEDDKNLAQALESSFTDAGYSVVLSYNGKEGLAKAAEMQPSVILLDVLIPDVIGWDVLKQLKSTEQTKNIPVIVDSNLYSAEREMEMLNMGALEYIVKSNTDPEGVVKKVSDILSKQNKQA